MSNLVMICALMGSRFEQFKLRIADSMINSYRKYKNHFKKLCFVVNGFNDNSYMELLDIYQDLKDDIEFIIGDKKLKSFNKHLPYCLKYGFNDTLLIHDDDIPMKEEIIQKLIEAYYEYPNEIIITSACHFYHYRFDNIIKPEYARVPFPCTVRTNCVNPLEIDYLLPLSYVKDSPLYTQTEYTVEGRLIFRDLIFKNKSLICLNYAHTLNYDTDYIYGPSNESLSLGDNCPMYQSFDATLKTDLEFINKFKQNHFIEFIVEPSTYWSFYLCKDKLIDLYKTKNIRINLNKCTNAMKLNYFNNIFVDV